ncbi:hypothetical protein EVAR_51048_1 [Eumeta japonica]|uniref:Uncharacterized protein n=1 Tax=Eumeta variegata TaxID=151549 RepID=A0A4C1Z6I4_EUMVA|nr:hypothetical protein EVAR_51048_1 [Eumeta japonica]
MYDEMLIVVSFDAKEKHREAAYEMKKLQQRYKRREKFLIRILSAGVEITRKLEANTVADIRGTVFSGAERAQKIHLTSLPRAAPALCANTVALAAFQISRALCTREAISN